MMFQNLLLQWCGKLGFTLLKIRRVLKLLNGSLKQTLKKHCLHVFCVMMLIGAWA